MIETFRAERTTRVHAAKQLSNVCGFTIDKDKLNRLRKDTGYDWEPRIERKKGSGGVKCKNPVERFADKLRIVAAEVVKLQEALGLPISEDLVGIATRNRVPSLADAEEAEQNGVPQQAAAAPIDPKRTFETIKKVLTPPISVLPSRVVQNAGK